MEGSKSITLTPAVLLSLVLTIIPAAGGVIYKMSQNDSKLQDTITEVNMLRKKVDGCKKANTSELKERIAALEADNETVVKAIGDMKADLKATEGSITSWSEKEFEKVYDILNNNPLGK